ncbi:hypothetical protein DN752_20830 [Echinicola strongylocentroti]|uniref:Outer membrane protein beta-barrel domain-containing protein n=1 Tax=Echinicola strongylocentroti TaxID=1795355 RepID=A0A2Z4INQ3_9BACT|nr:hypothetical protein [Echinicola strongylocentroti]AWW32389.1 hypothetical protein DN752_20830 [Echinicola strongylocentroti]
MKKDWRNMSDKELDDFFKQQSEQPDIPFVPEDWDKMKRQLASSSANGAARPWYKRGGMWLGPLLLLLLVGGWMTWSLGDFENESIGTVEISAEAPLATNKESGKKQVDADKVLQGDQSRKVGKSVNNSSQDESDGDGYGAFSADRTSKAKGGNPKNTIQDENGRLMKEAILSPVRGVADIPVPEFGVQWMLDNGKYALPLESNHVREPQKEKKMSSPEFWHDRRWSVAGLLSPDISALKWKDIHGVGTSAGLVLEYFIHPKWSVNVGFMYAFKTYQGEEDYSAFGYYGAGKVALKGDCYVFDVSTDVRYYAFSRDLDRWYLGAGLSSYFMLREKYDIEYESANGYPTHKELDIKSENNHLFSVVNLSIGYERDLSERLSLQVAPYYKTPWRGIGEGDVNLKSAGVMIGLKYSW